jgi:hypothetical protein
VNKTSIFNPQAGLLASRVGYKCGIITGLLMVGVGGYWILAATHNPVRAKSAKRFSNHSPLMGLSSHSGSVSTWNAKSLLDLPMRFFEFFCPVFHIWREY